MSKYSYVWVGANGFIDANVSATHMRGDKITCNGNELDNRKPYQSGDVIEFDDDVLAGMLDTNANWARNKSVKSKSVKDTKELNKDEKEEDK